MADVAPEWSGKFLAMPDENGDFTNLSDPSSSPSHSKYEARLKAFRGQGHNDRSVNPICCHYSPFNTFIMVCLVLFRRFFMTKLCKKQNISTFPPIRATEYFNITMVFCSAIKYSYHSIVLKRFFIVSLCVLCLSCYD